ncbi:lysine N(6)-hydroxylase/L-ornithine N(5)-oxygenase family protein [Veronia pacifica]|uniref:Alcaligin biosynthesis protein n=1 Tax=Veronia pacifica TaxID=1080227 RepID=A0A1C3ESC8_9GAMM|nr:SidA/IucD/PvdA family monooxygenase [Veronia pacifica]ODA36172.1 alcaligin biosynthesis protein [Veronia pacifica]
MKNRYDFIAIGLGPFNLSLACLTEPVSDLKGLFLEKKTEFNWHPGLMIDGVNLQTPFLSDLVTLADPTSSYSFLNYAKSKGKLYRFYIKEDFFLLRKEYNQYCQWATSQLVNIIFDREVIDIKFCSESSLYHVISKSSSGEKLEYYTERIILGTGPQPNLTEAIDSNATNIIHSGQYLNQKQKLIESNDIVIVGSGQSAAEIYYDLLSSIRNYNYHLTWVTRAERFFPLELTKLTLEMTSPDYIDYFYSLTQDKKDELICQQKSLYKGINSSLVNQIYDLLYELSLDGDVPTRLLTNSELVSQSSSSLSFKQNEVEKTFSLSFDQLIMATGFHYKTPDFLRSIMSELNLDENKRFNVSRDYTINDNRSIFVQNAELHTHGFCAPDLGMACYRNSKIINQMVGYEYYSVEKKVPFQEFSADETGFESNKGFNL